MPIFLKLSYSTVINKKLYYAALKVKATLCKNQYFCDLAPLQLPSCTPQSCPTNYVYSCKLMEAVVICLTGKNDNQTADCTSLPMVFMTDCDIDCNCYKFPTFCVNSLSLQLWSTITNTPGGLKVIWCRFRRLGWKRHLFPFYKSVCHLHDVKAVILRADVA